MDHNKKALIHTPTLAILEDIDLKLWDFSAPFFLPHDLCASPHPQKQPILLSDKTENTNDAEFLFLLPQGEYQDMASFERIFILFTEEDEADIIWARNLYKQLKSTDKNLSYWLQDDDGKWQKQS